MKNFFIIIIIITTTMLLSCCNLIGNNIIKSPKQNQIKSTEPASTMRIPTSEQELVYVNKTMGYQINFPEGWRGYYVITEHSSGDISINFYGKSKTGQISHGGNGLSMFQITKDTMDGDGIVGKIGEINGVEYFYAQRGGFQIGTLYEISDFDSGVKEIMPFKVDEKELKLAAQDWEKAKEMYKDIDDIIKTFKAIE